MRALAFIMIVSSSALAAAEPEDLGASARAALERHCAPCHGGGSGGDRGGFDSVMDLERLVASGLVVRSEPDKSLLLERVEAGEMPPRAVKTRPTEIEKDTLRRWIAAGAPAAKGRAPATRRARLGFSTLDQEIAADLAASPASARSHLRYLTIAHLHDAGVSEEALTLARAGTAKVLASLSWKEVLPTVSWVGSGKTAARVDLRELAWSRDVWEAIAQADPYGLRRVTPAARRIAKLARSEAAVIRADWFATAATRPALYHSILALPASASELAAQLGVERSEPLLRAGFNRSGISKHNRVIERRATRVGSYLWRSYDFRGSSGKRSIFDHPLGPGGSDGFAADGGELIFGLPNGMQAYMLVDADGKRIDKAPTDVVFDPSRPDGAVENGISCIGCHAQGMIDKADEVRAHLIANRGAFDARDPRTAEVALRVYRPANELTASFDADRARFTAALDALGANTSREPVTALAELFDRELDLDRAAAELGLDEATLRERIKDDALLGRNLGALAVRGGTLKRDVFAGLFPTVAPTLGGGESLSKFSPEVLLSLRCEDGDGRDCLEAGLALRGRRDNRRAILAFSRACDRRVARGCREAGRLASATAAANELFGRGCDQNDVASCALLADRLQTSDPNRSLALSTKACKERLASSCVLAGDLRAKFDQDAEATELYREACDLKDATGCAKIARRLHRGRDGRANKSQAAGFYVLACEAGDDSSCLVAGHLYYEGDGVAKRHSLSASLFERACQAGSGDGCYRFAKQLRSGKGVRRDKPRAKKLFTRACALGKKRACLR